MAYSGSGACPISGSIVTALPAAWGYRQLAAWGMPLAVEVTAPGDSGRPLVAAVRQRAVTNSANSKRHQRQPAAETAAKRYRNPYVAAATGLRHIFYIVNLW